MVASTKRERALVVSNDQPFNRITDGGVIGSSGIIYGQNGSAIGQGRFKADTTFDQSGNVTARSNLLPGWLGKRLRHWVLSGSRCARVFRGAEHELRGARFRPFGVAMHHDTLGYFSYTAIKWVMSKLPPSPLKQLPEPLLNRLLACTFTPFAPICATSMRSSDYGQSPDFIFQNYIQKFAPSQSDTK